MGRGRIIRNLAAACCLFLLPAATAAEFKHVGDFLLQAHFKLTGDKISPIPMKPIAFRVTPMVCRSRFPRKETMNPTPLLKSIGRMESAASSPAAEPWR